MFPGIYFRVFGYFLTQSIYCHLSANVGKCLNFEPVKNYIFSNLIKTKLINPLNVFLKELFSFLLIYFTKKIYLHSDSCV